MATPRANGFWRAAAPWVAVVFVGITATWVIWAKPWSDPAPAIRSDGSGYHLWTHAIVDGDFSFCSYDEAVRVGALSARHPERAVCQNKYPPGLALLKLPVMGPYAAAGESGGEISGEEHVANDVLAVLALITTAALLTSTGRHLGLRSWATQLSLLAVVFGTGLFHYSTYDASFSHLWSALGFAVLVHAWARSRGQPLGFGTTTVVAIATFFLVLTRNTHVLPLAVMAVAFLLSRRLLILRKEPPVLRLPRVAKELGPAVVGAAAALVLQLAYNRWATGELRVSSYGSEQFLFDRPMQRSVVLSFERGLLTYYPVVGVALAAGLLVRRARPWALTALGATVALVVLYGYWSSWFLGGGFGHRGFTELAPLYFLALAAALSAAPRPGRWVMVPMVVVASFVTLELMAGYWTTSIPYVGTTDDVYWAHVLGDDAWLDTALDWLRGP